MTGAGHNGLQHGGTGRNHHFGLLNCGHCAAVSRGRRPVLRQRSGFLDWYVPSTALFFVIYSDCPWLMIPPFSDNSLPHKLAGW